MRILGIETTCDETGVAIVENGIKVIASVVASSAQMHQKYGGVVPEVAAREQVRLMIPTLDLCLTRAGDRHSLKEIDAVAVAYGPGLVGSLLIGVETAKTLALVLNKPLIAVNHLVGHIYANWISASTPPEFPLVALIVSGGHTDLVLMKDHKHLHWLGGTRDDACGEAFDKVAKILGLGYPGGPEIERVARQYTTDSILSTVKFPRPMIGSGDFDFSFSGIKTAVANFTRDEKLTVEKVIMIAFSFQEAVVDVLVRKTIKAAKTFKVKSIVVGGGVAANDWLRSRLHKESLEAGIPAFFPDKNMAVDNGAMIAACAFYQGKAVDPLRLQANPGLHF